MSHLFVYLLSQYEQALLLAHLTPVCVLEGRGLRFRVTIDPTTFEIEQRFQIVELVYLESVFHEHDTHRFQACHPHSKHTKDLSYQTLRVPL